MQEYASIKICMHSKDFQNCYEFFSYTKALEYSFEESFLEVIFFFIFFFTNNEMVSFFFFEIFPVASLLSCLHNLRQENMRLEDHVASLNRRREHLLAVNARLSIPLSVQPSSHSYSGNSASLSDRSTPGRL